VAGIRSDRVNVTYIPVADGSWSMFLLLQGESLVSNMRLPRATLHPWSHSVAAVALSCRVTPSTSADLALGISLLVACMCRVFMPDSQLQICLCVSFEKRHIRLRERLSLF